VGKGHGARMSWNIRYGRRLAAIWSIGRVTCATILEIQRVDKLEN